jgi:hypothetical protein
VFVKHITERTFSASPCVEFGVDFDIFRLFCVKFGGDFDIKVVFVKSGYDLDIKVGLCKV